ncbi:multiple PDZ domain protein-like [Penaeus indicus]|uniref:multiple PDZ domain protein-like n=1 Tax=Penaeus indicus TaxID=29960 RepID=UPI00300CEBBD
MANICDLNCTCHDILESMGKPPCYLCTDQECSIAGRRKANHPLQSHLDAGDFRRETSPSTARQRRKTSPITIKLSRNWYTRLGLVVARDVRNRVVIHDILPGTLAEQDGRLQVGDVLVKADGQDIDDLEMCQVYECLRTCGNTISLRVLPEAKRK